MIELDDAHFTAGFGAPQLRLPWMMTQHMRALEVARGWIEKFRFAQSAFNSHQSQGKVTT